MRPAGGRLGTGTQSAADSGAAAGAVTREAAVAAAVGEAAPAPKRGDEAEAAAVVPTGGTAAAAGAKELAVVATKAAAAAAEEAPAQRPVLRPPAYSRHALILSVQSRYSRQLRWGIGVCCRRLHQLYTNSSRGNTSREEILLYIECFSRGDTSLYQMPELPSTVRDSHLEPNEPISTSWAGDRARSKSGGLPCRRRGVAS